MTINHYGWRYYVQWQTITTSQNKTQDTQRVKDHGSMRLVTIRSSSLDLKLWPLLAGSNDLQPPDDGHHWSSIQANAPNFHRTGTLQLSQLELPWPHPNSSTSERRSAVKIGHGWTMADPTKATKIPRFAKRPTAVWIFGVRNLEWVWAEKTATHLRRIEEYCYGDTA